MIRGFLKEILKLDQTVFSFKELTLLWPKADPDTLKSRVNYYIKKGDLYHIRRGLYAKDKNYNRLELATKIYTPSYVSFETVLATAGIIFQHYSQIFVAAYQSKTLTCDGQNYIFKRIKPEILTNSAGVEIKDYYSIASPERAFLDILYLHKSYYFDNLAPLDWNKVFNIVPIYNNKRMEKVVDAYHKSKQKSSKRLKQHLGISMKDMVQEDIAAHKLVAMYEKMGTAQRDIFDVWFFLHNNWPINKKIVEQRTQISYKKFLEECINALEKLSDRTILSGIGELLNEKQKAWAKKNLKNDTIFLLKLAINALE